jgi:hypothetical protein
MLIPPPLSGSRAETIVPQLARAARSHHVFGREPRFAMAPERAMGLINDLAKAIGSSLGV